MSDQSAPVIYPVRVRKFMSFCVLSAFSDTCIYVLVALQGHICQVKADPQNPNS